MSKHKTLKTRWYHGSEEDRSERLHYYHPFTKQTSTKTWFPPFSSSPRPFLLLTSPAPNFARRVHPRTKTPAFDPTGAYRKTKHDHASPWPVQLNRLTRVCTPVKLKKLIYPTAWQTCEICVCNASCREQCSRSQTRRVDDNWIQMSR
jgi:hypothetical protein